MSDLKGRVAVVTGAASGIGAACLRRLQDAGARAVGWDLAEFPGGVRCDVSDAASVAEALARTEAQAGPPSLLIAAAGVGEGRFCLDLDVGHWDRVMAINLRGVMLCVQALARSLVARKETGAMVLISSVNSVVADPGVAAYSASKAAVNQFARVAARELGPHGIRINVVGPGPTATPMLAHNVGKPGYLEEVAARTALGRIGQPEDVAEAAVGLLHMDWVTGQVLMADGGSSLNTGRSNWRAQQAVT